METTIGNILVNEALPEELRDYTRVMDKKGTKALLRNVAEKYPDKYKEIAQSLLRVGQSASTTGEFSYSLRDFLPSKKRVQMTTAMQADVQKILGNKRLTDEQRNAAIIERMARDLSALQKGILDEGVKNGNRLAQVVASGSKGSPVQYNTTVGASLLFSDHKDDVIPIPVMRSAAEGLDPAAYFASSYGTRKGVISTKFATQVAGDFAKQLAKSAQRLVITEEDCGTDNGISVPASDAENVGTVLARNTNGMDAGTILEKQHIRKMKGDIIVRSPATCQAKQGLCSKCAGIRERGQLPEIGDNIGIPAGQSLSERLSQGSLDVKHSAGAAGAKKNYTFDDVKNMFQVPKKFPGSAAIAGIEGPVSKIEKSEAGGAYIHIGQDKYYADDIADVKVKVGDRVEPGDILTEGIVNPKELAQYRGIGAARRTFIDELQRVSGNRVSRRNAEVIARAAVGHVRITGVEGPRGTMMNDIARYDDLVSDWEPREGSQEASLTAAKGKYLERPVLHYSIGTRVNSRMVNTLKNNGVKNILVHDDEPPFEADVQRLKIHTSLDPDWMTRMGGYYLKDTLLKGVHRGVGSSEHSTSFLPSLAKGVDFGDDIDTKGVY